MSVKYTVELGEKALRELAELLGQPYSLVTRSGNHVKYSVEEFIHQIYNEQQMVKTNIGEMPKKDYEEISLFQNGFESKEELQDEVLEIQWGDTARDRELEIETLCSDDSHVSVKGIASDFLSAKGFNAPSEFLHQYGENYDYLLPYDITEANHDAVYVKVYENDFNKTPLNLVVPVSKIDCNSNGNVGFGDIVLNLYKEKIREKEIVKNIRITINSYYDTGDLLEEFNGWKFKREKVKLNGTKYYGYKLTKDNETMAIIAPVPEKDCYRIEATSDYIAMATADTHNKYTHMRVEHFGKLFSDSERQSINNEYAVKETDIMTNLYLSYPEKEWVKKADITEVKKALLDCLDAVSEFSIDSCSNQAMKYYQNSTEGYYGLFPDGPHEEREEWDSNIRAEQMKWVDSCEEKLKNYNKAAEVLKEYDIIVPSVDLPLEAQALITENKIVNKVGIIPDRDSLLVDIENAIIGHSNYPLRYYVTPSEYIDYEIIGMNENKIDIGFREGNINFPGSKSETDIMTIRKSDFSGYDIGLHLKKYTKEKNEMVFLATYNLGR